MLTPEQELLQDLAEMGLSAEEDGQPLEDLADDEARARYCSASLPASALAMLEREQGARELRQPPAAPSRPPLTAEQEALSRRYLRS